MKKKIMALLVIIMALTLLVACSGAKNEKANINSSDSVSSESESIKEKEEKSISSSSESSEVTSSESSQTISKGVLSLDKFKEVCLKYYTEEEFTHEAEYDKEEEISETYMFEKGNVMVSLAVFKDGAVIDDYFAGMKEEFSTLGDGAPVTVDENTFTVVQEEMSAYMKKYDNVILAIASLDEDGKKIAEEIISDLGI